MMLGYVYVDFRQFGQDVRVSCPSDFLLQIDEFSCEGFNELVTYATMEIVVKLTFLHSKGIAHRDLDLRPGNRLISNQHYAELSDDEVTRQYHSRPIVCKVADFGEGRSHLIKTHVHCYCNVPRRPLAPVFWWLKTTHVGLDKGIKSALIRSSFCRGTVTILEEIQSCLTVTLVAAVDLTIWLREKCWRMSSNG